MCNKELIKLISEYQQHNMEDFHSLYGAFKKLLDNYGSKQEDSDVLADLTDFFVELLFKIDLSRFSLDNSDSLQRYIAVCIRNEYNLMREKRTSLPVPDEEFISTVAAKTPSFEDRLFIKECLSVVTETERKILILRYISGYSDAEIAEFLHISRQAVGKARNKGIETIRRFLRQKTISDFQTFYNQRRGAGS